MHSLKEELRRVLSQVSGPEPTIKGTVIRTDSNNMAKCLSSRTTLQGTTDRDIVNAIWGLDYSKGQILVARMDSIGKTLFVATNTSSATPVASSFTTLASNTLKQITSKGLYFYPSSLKEAKEMMRSTLSLMESLSTAGNKRPPLPASKLGVSGRLLETLSEMARPKSDVDGAIVYLDSENNLLEVEPDDKKFHALQIRVSKDSANSGQLLAEYNGETTQDLFFFGTVVKILSSELRTRGIILRAEKKESLI